MALATDADPRRVRSKPNQLDRFRRKAPVAHRGLGRLNWAYFVEKVGN
jgi:hypothetical protein